LAGRIGGAIVTQELKKKALRLMKSKNRADFIKLFLS
jgi:hypothetical protein